MTAIQSKLLVLSHPTGPQRPLLRAGCALLLALLPSATAPARAADPENCLSCHRYRGLARIGDDQKTVHMYHVNPDYYDRALGPHARLRCTDCHARKEVGVIPHHTVSPVSCSTTCHLSAPGNVEVTFSHDRIADMLQNSVHTGDVLEKSNQLLGSPLQPAQARCLLCHDEPVFRRAGESWLQSEAPVARCEICHEPGGGGPMIPNPRFMYWHVTARSRQARSHGDLVRVCALCHSDTRIRQEFKLPDTTASYLASFHGKAMQLGSEETAGCLDCHVAKTHNVHVMQSSQKPGSSTAMGQLPNTCRSPSCHAYAGARISTAAMHLDLSTSEGVEYLIAALFVVLIVFTFGPSVVLQTLELLQVVVGRHEPGHEQRRRMAERLMADPRGRHALKRFSVGQRLQHWLLVIAFTTLVLTGFPLKFADRTWARWLVDEFGGISTTRMLHRWAGVLLIAGFFLHISYVIWSAVRQKRRTGQSWMRTFLELPMVVNSRDVRQMGQLLAYLLFLRRRRPEAGRFSLEEKFEYFGVFWGTALLGGTGLLLWANARTSSLLTGRVLTIAMLVHTFEAFLALLHVGIIHLVGVIFAPAVFPLSPAMFTGDTPPEELSEAHSGMLNEVAQQVGIEPTGEAAHG